MSRRPHFAREFHRYMDVKGISSFDQIAKDLSQAGYRPGKKGKLYRSKVSGFIHRNEAVPDSFIRFMDRVYGIDDHWRLQLAFAEYEDRLERPIEPGKGWL